MNKKTKQVQVRFVPDLYSELHGELIKQGIYVDEFFNHLARIMITNKTQFKSTCSEIKQKREKNNG